MTRFLNEKSAKKNILQTEKQEAILDSMTSSSLSENFVLSMPVVEYKGDDGEVLYLEDIHLTQDFKMLAELKNPPQQVLEFTEDTVANFDENLLTNANFKSTSEKSSFTNDDQWKSISTDSGNASESSRRLGKKKRPQLEDTIAKRTRSKFLLCSPRITCNFCDSQASNDWNSNRENIQNHQIVQLSTSTDSKEKKIVPDREKDNTELSTNINSPSNKTFSSYEQSELINTVNSSEKATNETTEFKTNINPLNKTIYNYKQPEETSNLSETVPDSCKETDANTNSPINNCKQQISALNNNISASNKINQNYDLPEEALDSKKIQSTNIKHVEERATIPLKTEPTTMIDIIYQLEEFETMVNDFRGVLIGELSSKSSMARSSVEKEVALSKSEEGNSEREEELLIFYMEDEYKRKFGENEERVHGEDAVKSPIKMPKWKNKLSKYNCNDAV